MLKCQRLLSFSLLIFMASGCAKHIEKHNIPIDAYTKKVQTFTSYDCPVLGTEYNFMGLDTEEGRDNLLLSSLSDVQSRANILTNAQRQFNQEKGKVTSKSNQGDLKNAEYNIQMQQATLVDPAIQASLANLASASMVEHEFDMSDSVQGHPLYQNFVTLDTLEKNLYSVPGTYVKSKLFTPVISRHRQCLNDLSKYIAVQNQGNIEAHINMIGVSNIKKHHINNIQKHYFLADLQKPTTVSEVPELLSMLENSERLAIIAEKEKAAAQERVARQAGERNKNIAQRLVNGVNNRSLSSISSLLASNVKMITTQKGNHYGRSNVIKALKQVINNPDITNISNPYFVNGYDVQARINTAKGSAYMAFDFQGDRISQIKTWR